MNYFTKHIWLPISALLLVYLFLSCEREEIVQPFDEDVVYMSFHMGPAAKKIATRAQGDTPTINTDSEDMEDYVNKLAVLVFESGTTGKKVAEKHTTEKHTTDMSVFTMKIPLGTYDFYFIANYPGDSTTIKAINSKAEIDNYLIKAGRVFTPFQGAKTPDGLFPMARVYKDQKLTAGGTKDNPTRFQPNVGSVGNDQLLPISSYGPDFNSFQHQATVNLVRANAKVEVDIYGEGIKDVDKVEYINASKEYTFKENITSLPTTVDKKIFTIKDITDTNGAITNKTGKVYVPERLFPTSEGGWDTANDEAKDGVNYIKITMKSTKVYKIPVISSMQSVAKEKYMTYSRNITNSDDNYNIIRNNHYFFNINVPEDDKLLDVNLKVMPWTLVESQYDYVRPTYTIEVIRDGVTMKDIQSEVELPDALDGTVKPVTIKFSISAPLGALWTASITNGLEFDLTGTDHGIVDGTNTTYTMTITPRKPFDKEPRYTQFFISVDGKEIFLGYKEEPAGSGTYVLDNRYIGEGTPYRWKFKQIMTK